jgi:hypothetical protein
MNMDKRAQEINKFYGVDKGASPSPSESARHAANARWKDRGGPSTTIRVSVGVAERLNQEIPQPERRPFCDAAITEALDKRPSTSSASITVSPHCNNA